MTLLPFTTDHQVSLEGFCNLMMCPKAHKRPVSWVRQVTITITSDHYCSGNYCSTRGIEGQGKTAEAVPIWSWFLAGSSRAIQDVLKPFRHQLTALLPRSPTGAVPPQRAPPQTVSCVENGTQSDRHGLSYPTEKLSTAQSTLPNATCPTHVTRNTSVMNGAVKEALREFVVLFSTSFTFTLQTEANCFFSTKQRSC